MRGAFVHVFHTRLPRLDVPLLVTWLEVVSLEPTRSPDVESGGAASPETALRMHLHLYFCQHIYDIHADFDLW